MAKTAKQKKSKIKLLVPIQSASGWMPKVNGELDELVEELKITQDEKKDLRERTVAILGNCLPPSVDEGSLTGLVIGRVQSGKTMSFTALTSLARDNMYQMIVIITGTTTSLSDQSVNRLKRDLRLSSRNGLKWFFGVNPRKNQASNIQSKLDLWKDSQTADHFKQTLLLAVSKNHRHILNLNQLLAELDLKGVSTIIIDDEADQASLNSKVRRQDQSTTYLRILEMRRLIPAHTYVQYTATPQAPLLINKIDVLSPRFVELIEPGKDYIGGEEFFQTGFQQYLVEIPANELPTAWQDTSPPPSLERSLRMFLIGACDQICQKEPEKRSMMIHPSMERAPHEVYHRWVKNLRDNWSRILQKNGKDKDAFIKEFKADYDNLKQTAPDLAVFDKLIANLSQVLKIVQLEEVNARTGKTPTVEWSNALFHILVGGQAMDRGFTVEGLTVTYMPRPSGVGNADTIQQRARFFGYKRKYLGICRIFLEAGVQDSFIQYVHHEGDLRTRLAEHKKTKKPLTDWKRHFFLDSNLTPTRTSVLDIDYARGNLEETWVTQNYPASGGDEVVQFNRDLVELWKKHLNFEEFEGHRRRTKEQVHSIGSVALSELYEKFLVLYKMGDASDSQQFTGMLLQLKAKLTDNPGLAAHLVVMSPASRSREREVATNGKVKKLFQGANYDRKTREEIYPGDSHIRIDSEVTVQIHNLDLKVNGRIQTANVPTISVWMPDGFGNAWLVE